MTVQDCLPRYRKWIGVWRQKKFRNQPKGTKLAKMSNTKESPYTFYNTGGYGRVKNMVFGNNKNGGRFQVCFLHENNSKEISEENAVFVADCFNVKEETGKTPRQLADINTELLEALKGMCKYWEKYIGRDAAKLRALPVNEFYRKSKLAIQKANE